MSIADRIIRALLIIVAVFVANRAPYAWYWQLAILVALTTITYGIVLAIQLALASRNK